MMNRVTRIIRNIVAAILVAAGVCTLVARWFVRRPLPKLDGTLAIEGLKSPVSVDRDRWGRPWIRASSVDDLVIGQGFVMAQDRMWQMDLLRRASAGELSEILGPATLEYDEENRELGMREAADRAVADSSPEIRALLEDYSRGVNDYIRRHQQNLPIEFQLLRYKPKPWTPADTYLISLYMYKTLTTTWKAKLNRQWIEAKVGPERAQELFYPDSDLDIPVIGAPDVPSETRSANHANLRGLEEEIGKQSANWMTGSEFAPIYPEGWLSALNALGQFDRETLEIAGSNNFVVSGAHTASGRPLLANDTHLGLGVPSIWYLMHLTAAEWDVEGFALPGAPLVIIGHNNRIAWGFTNSNADVEDLYVETFNPANLLEYRVNDKWLAAQVRHETIHVKGVKDVSLDVVVTRHGPIVYRDPAKEGGKAYSLRWTALEPGGLDFGFPLLGRARNWSEFIETTRHIAGPGQNTIYADVDGNIGFTIPAKIPIRANKNGSLPVPGDTDANEWTGYIPFEDLPRVENPAGGIIVTANARTVGPAYKYYLTDRWAAPYRTNRIHQLLVGRTDLTAADCNSIQNDIFSMPNDFLAQQLIAASRAKQPKDSETSKLIHGLEGWDGRATTDSAETSFVEYTRHSLIFKLLAPSLGYGAMKYELWEPLSVYEDVWWRDKEFLRRVLTQRPSNWLPSGYASYDDLLLASADEATGELEKERNSSQPADWKWGRLHQLDMLHPLGRGGLLHWLLSVGPYESSGTIDTVRAMGRGHGPAMRFVADLSNFDLSLMEVSTGESGQYSSPYYRDQFKEWFAGRGIAAPFSQSAEARAEVHHLQLIPERR